MKIAKEEIYEDGFVVPVLHEQIVSHSRWSVGYDAVVEYKGKHYRVHFTRGATEMQDEMPFDYVDEIDAEEVMLKEIVVKQWVPVSCVQPLSESSTENSTKTA